jgi:error-prone DNA polymerase
MGFYPPDALVHEAQRRGVEILPPDVNASAVLCDAAPGGGVRIGLGYVLGVKREEVEALVAAREAGGPFRDLGDLASRAGAGTPALEALAWSGAVDALAGGDRRVALWRLGAAAPGRKVRGGTQLALPLDMPAAPELQPLGEWDETLADYATTGVSTRRHPIGILRPELPADVVTAAALDRLPHGTPVRIAGQVVARQRPATARGIVFMLIEDETGTANLIVSPELYEKQRLTVRTEPLLLAEGKLEKHPAACGNVNILIRGVRALEAPGAPVAEVKDFSPLDEREREKAALARQAVGGTGDETRSGDFRAVAPPVMSFASGRRR